MVLTPRKSFQENKQHVIRHQELAVSESFRAACEAALAEQVLALPLTYDVNEAAAGYHRLIGARDFISHLLNLAEKTKPPIAPLPTNLDFNA